MNSLRLMFLLFYSVKLEQVCGVWPMPQRITQSNERYVLNPRLFSYHHADDSAVRRGCSLLDAAFIRYFRIVFPDFEEETGLGFSYTWPQSETFTVSVNVRSGGCDEYPNEGSNESYSLVVSQSQAVLKAESVWGALRGLESFSQLVYQDEYNSSHTYPNLSKKGAFHPGTHIYTQSDVKRVNDHARLRGIRVVPEFDSPGHTQSWGKGQPDLLTPCYKKAVPSGTFGPINPTLSSSYQFMRGLFKEVTSVFPDSFVHLGGDEVDFKCWKSNPNVQAFMANMGFGHDYTKLESFYMEGIMNITAAFNKTTIVWQDAFDYHKPSRPQYVVEVWKRGCYLCKVRQLVKAGLKVILAAPFYLDLPGPTYDWAHYYTVRPLFFKGTEQQKKLVIGGEVCMWGEYVDAANLSPRLWPRASAAAERLWSNEEQTSSVDKAFPRLQDFRCKLIRRDIQAEPLFIGHCKHEYNT